MLIAPSEGFDRVQISSYYVLTLLILSSYSWRDFHALCAGDIMYYSPRLWAGIIGAFDETWLIQLIF